MAIGRHEDSLRMMRNAVRVLPQNHDLWFSLAWLYHNRRLFALAGCVMSLRIVTDIVSEQAYVRAIQLNPMVARYHYNYGNLLMETRRFAAAIDVYKKSLDVQVSSDTMTNLV